MANDLVSIIMPNYNCEKYIEETVNSVLNQTYQNWELLIVDDCSSDNSLVILKRFEQNDNRIKVYVNETNKGAAYSRNLALREAKGKWIAFLDSDDLWVPEKLEKQITFMKENDYHFSFTKYGQIDQYSNSLNTEVSGPKKVTPKKMFRYCYLGCLTVIYDSEIIGIVQINDNIKKRNDYAIWLKVCKKATCYYLNEKLAFYRKRVGSISHQSKFSLIKYHYYLFRNSENMSCIHALFCTLRNLFFGVFKKLKYVKKVDK